MTEADALRYLVRQGFVDAASVVGGDVRLVDASRRNCNFRVVRGSGPSYLFKRASGRDGFRSTAREALVYGLISETVGSSGVWRFVPAVHGVDEDEGVLILELFADAEDLRQYHQRSRRFSCSLSQQVGRALATLHHEGTVALARAHGRLVAPQPAAFAIDRPGVPLLTDFSSAAVELVQLIQGSPPVRRLLQSVRDEWREEAFIHQDARWDNVLVVRSGARRAPTIKLIDWEAAGLGDPCWDLGCFFGDYIGFWVNSIPLSGGAAPQSYLELARYPLARMQPALRACWRQYARAARLEAAEESEFLRRTARYAGLKLVQSALEQVQGVSQLDPSAVCLLQVGVNMMERSTEAVTVLLGLSRN